MRPPNLVTAVADVLAGFAVAGLARPEALPWLVLSTIGLYGGGVVLNDVLDARLDAVERPERPLPSGRASLRGASLLGAGLLSAGVAAAFAASTVSGWVAVLIAGLAVLYDALGKHHPVLGPLNMGACRGLNLMLGASIAPAIALDHAYLATLPIAYIAAITAVSAGEVHGGRPVAGRLALGLVGAVMLGLLGLALGAGPWGLPFVALLAWRVLPPFWRASTDPRPGTARAAVRAGVLSLIALDAALAAIFAGPLYGAAVLALVLVAALAARPFQVT